MFSIYKKKQGLILRWGAFFASASLFMFGAYKFYLSFPYSNILAEDRPAFWQWVHQSLLSFTIPGVNIAVDITPRLITSIALAISLLLILGYLCFRHKKLSDFFIDTESEMRKVAWPTKSEVVQSSIVVIIAIFILGVYLFVVDSALSKILRVIFFKISRENTMVNSDNEKSEKQDEHIEENEVEEAMNIVSDAPQSTDISETLPSEESSEKVASEETKWYVLRVQSGREDKVKNTLEKRVASMGMSDEIPQIMVPSELVSEIRKGFKRIVERKLYPGYVMVEMTMSEDAHYLVKSTPGVGDFAGAMSESEVERMLMVCCQAEDKPKPKISFRKGQSIKIKEGAFENYDGIVDDVNEQKGIVKVRIGIFGRYTQVELGYWQVESL